MHVTSVDLEAKSVIFPLVNPYQQILNSNFLVLITEEVGAEEFINFGPINLVETLND